jgi:hypothetical protein
MSIVKFNELLNQINFSDLNQGEKVDLLLKVVNPTYWETHRFVLGDDTSKVLNHPLIAEKADEIVEGFSDDDLCDDWEQHVNFGANEIENREDNHENDDMNRTSHSEPISAQNFESNHTIDRIEESNVEGDVNTDEDKKESTYEVNKDVTSNHSDEVSEELIEKEISFELLKKKLIAGLSNSEYNDFGDTLEILQEIFDLKSQEYSTLKQLGFSCKDFDKQIIKGILDLNEEQREKKKIADSIIRFIHNQLKDSDLIINWQKNETIQLLLHSVNSNEEIDSLDRIDFDDIFTANIEIKNKNDITDQSKVREYEKVVRKGQLYYIAEDYEKAFDCFEKAADIFNESGQIFLYLAMSFCKKESAKKIITNYLEEDGKLFKNLLAFTKFHKNFEKTTFDILKERNSKSKKNTSPERVKNIHYALKDLSESLLIEVRRKYYSFRFNYLKGVVITDKSIEKAKMQKLLDLASRIYEIAPTLIFTSEAKNEIMGLNNFDWVEVSDNQVLINKVKNFDALSIIKILDEVYQKVSLFFGTDIKEAENKINARAYSQLRDSHRDIRSIRVRIIRQDRGNREKINDFNNLVSRFINCSKIVYKLHSDKRILIKAIQEIKGEGSRTEWIQLDDKAQLIDNEVFKISNGALKELKCLLSWIDEKNLNSELEELRSDICENKSGIAKKQYDALQEKVIAGTLDDRDKSKIIGFIKDWRIAYKVKKEESILKMLLSEISGNGLTQWFKLTKTNEIKFLSVNNPYAPNVNEQIEKVLDEVGITSEEAKKEYYANTLHQQVLKTYQSNVTIENHLQYLMEVKKYYRYSNCSKYFDILKSEMTDSFMKQWTEQIYIDGQYYIFSKQESLKIGFDPEAEIKLLKSPNTL